MFKRVIPVIDNTVRGLCTAPYTNHKKGCPNYNKKDGCPPAAPKLYTFIDKDQPIYVVYNIYDFGAHVKRMKDKHPEWSERQLACCLYWQGTARKELRIKIVEFLRPISPGRTKIIGCPEACGVNITATMRKIGEHLEWPPKTKTYQVVLAGTLIGEKNAQHQPN